MKQAKLAWCLLARDWRAGELQLLAAALVIAVTAVCAVSWLADRVAAASGSRAAELLAADRVVQSTEAIPADWLQHAQALGLSTARTAEFPSVVLADDKPHLVAVKAVEAPYPLRGTLQLQSAVGAESRAVQAVPEPGTAWVEPRLLGPLELAVGEELSLGEQRFTVAGLIALEPDRGGFFTGLAPRVMINYTDLTATGLIQPGSRVRYQLLLAGPEGALQRFRQALPLHEPGLEWRTPADSGLGVRDVMARAERFLGLAALLTVVIAGVAIVLTVRHYAQRQVDRVAILRCLGATAADVTALMAWKLLWLALLCGGIGIALGYLLHLAMLALIAQYLPPHVPPAAVYPIFSGWGIAFAALLGFAMPTVLRLRQVPPLRVLRRELGAGLFRGNAFYGIALAAIFLLMWWQARDPMLAALVFAAVLATLLLLAGLAWLLVRTMVRLRSRRQHLLWLSGITRRPASTSVQIMAIGVGLMALLLLTVVRQDLLSAWEDSVPAEAPNYFLINVQPEQVSAVHALLQAHQVPAEFHPMIRGRLVGINGRDVSPEQYADRAQRLVAREFNLSFNTEVPVGNDIIAGRWWSGPKPTPGQFSVEAGMAEDLGIHVGDVLRFAIGSEEATGTVTSLRQVQWDSFNVNFFVLAPPGLLEDYPSTFITSFYLPPGNQAVLAELVRRFPSVTVFDIDTILSTVRGIIAQGSRVVELMATLTLIAGLIVLLAALQTSGEERRFESALLRALGAKRGDIKRLARAEFWLIGAAAGALAGGCAAIAGVLMARWLFQLDYALDLRALLAGLIAGPLVVWLAGALATRRFYQGSPMRLLRGGSD